MSIQADRYLIKKSMLPTHMSNMGRGYFWEGVDFPVGGHTSFSDVNKITGAQIDQFLDEHPWFPMIAPFLPKQESYVDRPLTDSEKMDYYNDHHEGLFHPSARVIDNVGHEPILREKAISSGVSSYGYDVKCADEFKIFTNINSKTIDPKNFDPKIFVDHKGPTCIIPPNSFVLARTVEWFKIPRNVLTICLGKSTYARCGIIVNVTPLEPEWEGHVTLEFSNTTNLPAIIYANEGVAQMLFFEGEEEPLVSYKDRGGKYQGQSGVVVPRMK